MKKTLIALAVTASAVSGMAHAWTNGEFNSSINIGGNITVDDYRQKWSWTAGSDIDGLSNTINDMTDDGTKLTITENGDKPILLGKTNEAFATPTAGGLGTIPNITFTGYDGNSVALTNPTGITKQGLAYLTLPMKDADGSKIGSVKINLSYAGALLATSGSGNTATLYSLYATDNTDVFYGGLPTNVGGSELPTGTDAAARTAQFGSLSVADMFEQIQAVNPNITTSPDVAGSVYTQMVSTSGGVKSAAYVLGIANGQTIEATFDKPVKSSTQWSAPLNIAVTYN